MTPLSTEEVAEQLKISRVTLERWLASGNLRTPNKIKFGRNEFRDWTAADIERVRQYKAAHYRKGRGRKKRKKSKV
jgi:excisionase family DNA binding protein